MCGHVDQRLPYDLALLAEVIDEITSFPGWDPIVIPMHPIIVMTAAGVIIGRWGIQDGSKLHVHARRESLPGFWREEEAERRCAIPCLGWWEGSWHFSRPDVLCLAGIWRNQPVRGPASQWSRHRQMAGGTCKALGIPYRSPSTKHGLGVRRQRQGRHSISRSRNLRAME